VGYVNPIGYFILVGVAAALVGAFNILRSMEGQAA